MKTLVTTLGLAALALTTFANTADARPRHGNRIYVSGHRSCGTPIYSERYFVRYDRCGVPVWAVRPYCPPVVRPCPPPYYGPRPYVAPGVVFQATFTSRPAPAPRPYYPAPEYRGYK